MCATTAKKEPCSERIRVLVIFGSPRKNGSTAALVNAFTSALPKGVLIDRFDCYDTPPIPCNDCRYCHSNNDCAYDDLNGLYERLENSDILVFASPVYNLSFPAPMKALIDRMQRYWAARFKRGVCPPITRSKRAILITSCGSGTDSDMLERQLKPVLTVINTLLTHTIHYTDADKSEPLDSSFMQAAKAAVQLFEK